MVYEFRLPDIGEGVAEGEVVKWFVKEGDTIKEDAPLVSVLTDKANVEIPSPRGGKVLQLHAREGEKVKVGGLLVTMEAEGGLAPAPSTVAADVNSAPSEDIRTEAPLAGTTQNSPTPSARPGPGAGIASVLATPFVRRRATELGIDLRRIRGSGPGGRVVEADLESPHPVETLPPKEGETSATPPITSPVEHSTPAPAAPVAPVEGGERIPLRGIRRVIADHMSEATHRAAHYTYVEEVDATELVRLRDRLAKHIEKQGTKLSYLPFVVKAVVAGLKAQPWMNARMDDAANELVVSRQYNIGIATAAPEGLLVPVVHQADSKSIAKLAREIQELAEKARAGKLTRAEMSGGTFTITSLGPLGGVLATPILNYPEVAILGVHQIKRRPVYNEEGRLVPAQLMNLSVSLDHRVLDGIIGAQFLSVVKANLEDPHLLIAEMA